MTYHTTVTTKGQITIPKAFRDRLGLEKNHRVSIAFEPKDKSITVTPVLDFLEVARKIKVKKKINVLKAREYMEKNYERQ